MGRDTTRRGRARQATLAEIHTVARRLLVERGSAAVTINAVAREMGISGPALYHYYGSHNELVEAVTAGFLQELTDTMTQARDAAADAKPGTRLLPTCRAMRHWAISHPAEFQWVFAQPVLNASGATDSKRLQAGQRFEEVLLEQVVELWNTRPFPVPDAEELPASLLDQLTAYSAAIDHRLPPEAAHVFLTCWIRLYGLLCMEVLRQLDFAYSDLEPVFEQCLRELASTLRLGEAE